MYSMELLATSITSATCTFSGSSGVDVTAQEDEKAVFEANANTDHLPFSKTRMKEKQMNYGVSRAAAAARSRPSGEDLQACTINTINKHTIWAQPIETKTRKS